MVILQCKLPSSPSPTAPNEGCKVGFILLPGSLLPGHVHLPPTSPVPVLLSQVPHPGHQEVAFSSNELGRKKSPEGTQTLLRPPCSVLLLPLICLVNIKVYAYLFKI